MSLIETITDNAVDVAAIGAIAYVATAGPEPSAVVVGALTSIALGKKYLASRGA